MLTKLLNYLFICVIISISSVAFSQDKVTSSQKLPMNVSSVDFSKVDDSIKKDLELKGGLSLNFKYEGESKGNLFKRNWSELSNVLNLNIKEDTKIVVELWAWKDASVADNKVAGASYVIESTDIKEADVEIPLDEEGKLGSISVKLNFNDQAVDFNKSTVAKDSTNQFIQEQTQNTTDGSLVYVYLYTDNCPWCVRLKPEIQKLKQFLMSTRLGNVYQIRYAGQREYVSLGVRAFPTVLVYRNGTLIDRIVGYRNWEVLRTNAVDNVNK